MEFKIMNPQESLIAQEIQWNNKLLKMLRKIEQT